MIHGMFLHNKGLSIHGSCEDVIKLSSGNGIKYDYILTDPPYDIKVSGSSSDSHINNASTVNRIKGFTDGIDINIVHKLFGLCSKPNVTLFCSNKQVPSMMLAGMERKLITNLLAWHKPNGMPYANNVFKGNLEHIIHIRDKGVFFNATFADNSKVLSHNSPRPDKRIHPTEKPIELLANLIKLSCHPEGVVFDPYAGSMSTAMAAELCHSYFVTVEQDEMFYTKAVTRIAARDAQGDLFPENITYRKTEIHKTVDKLYHLLYRSGVKRYERIKDIYAK